MVKLIICPLIKLQLYFRIKEKKIEYMKYMKYEIYKREEKRKVPPKYRTVRVDVAMINTEQFNSNIGLI